MKKKELSKLGLTISYEKLDNGLEIYLVPMIDSKKYFMTYATRYGSTVNTFIPNGSKKEVTVPFGIAHFLEHKMFEMEDGVDPFTFFSESGTDANAATGYDYTKYICSGTKNFDDNLRYLINYVNKPYFTDSNVEKEKGIIAEEINMYKDEAIFALENTLRNNTYFEDLHRYDIAGEISDINSITKEDLYLCYDNFYSPRNMFILIVGNFDVHQTLNIIKEECVQLKNKYDSFPKIKKVNEPSSVKQRYQVVPFNITVPKLMMSIKLKRNSFNIDDEFKLDLYLHLIINVLFGVSSKFREDVLDNNLMTDFFTEVERVEGYRTIYMYAETTYPNELLDKINNEFNNIIIEESDLERYKKVWIANEIKLTESVDSTSDTLFEDIIRYGDVIGDQINIYKSLNMKELNDVISKFNIKNNSIVCYVPKNMSEFKLKIK